MIIAEPPQILLSTYGLNSTLQVSVYCDIAEERTVEQTVKTEGPEATWDRCQTGHKDSHCGSYSGLKGIQI